MVVVVVEIKYILNSLCNNLWNKFEADLKQYRYCDLNKVWLRARARFYIYIYIYDYEWVSD